MEPYQGLGFLDISDCTIFHMPATESHVQSRDDKSWSAQLAEDN
jgi:hypothetical protein